MGFACHMLSNGNVEGGGGGGGGGGGVGGGRKTIGKK